MLCVGMCVEGVCYVCVPTLSTVKTNKRFINARLVVAGFYKVLLLLTLGVE